MRTIRYIMIVIMVSWILPLYGIITKVGTTAAPFLTMPVGPRALGMGGAFVSVADDATAMFWNVAGIARLTHNEAVLVHTRWFAGIAFEYAGVVLPIKRFGTIGANFTYLDIGEMEQTTELDPEGTGVWFHCGSFAFGLSYARPLTDRFVIGFNVKYIEERIMNCRATGFAIDIGTLFRTQFKGTRFGMSISNYGTKMQMTGSDLLVQHDIAPDMAGNNPFINAYLATGRFDLPLLLRVGVSVDLVNTATHRLTVACDALHPNDNTESLNLGLEYVFNNVLSLRAGYKSLFMMDSEEGFTFGVGLTTSMRGVLHSMRIDYAYESFGRLSNVQNISVTTRF